MVDDAMEGGKLSPMHMRSSAFNAALRHPRRYSVAGNDDLGSFRKDIRSGTEFSPFSKSTSFWRAPRAIVSAGLKTTESPDLQISYGVSTAFLSFLDQIIGSLQV